MAFTPYPQDSTGLGSYDHGTPADRGKQDAQLHMYPYIGSEYQTGQRAPVSGVYRFVRMLTGFCVITSGAREIPLAKGEAFPPIRGCHGSVVWQLVRYA